MGKLKLTLPAAVLTLMLGANATATAPYTAPATDATDPYQWLEDIDGAKVMDWVKQRNAVSTKELAAGAGFEAARKHLLKIYDSKDKIPFVQKRGKYFYNFWQDAKNPRGLWRRATLAEYRRPHPRWETVLDIDALGAREKQSWVLKGVQCLYPDYARCLISLSRGGGDAVVVREFDAVAKSFVADGFNLPEAKSEVSWRDRDHLFVGTDFGEGTLTSSGYPRIVKSWKRGTPLKDAEIVFEGQSADVAVNGYSTDEPGYHREFVHRGVTFFSGETWLNVDGKMLRLEVPDDADPGTWRDQVTVTLRTDWTTGGKTWPGGALLAMDLGRFLKGERDFQVLFEPGARKSLAGVSATQNYLLVNELDHVHNRLYRLAHTDGAWQREPIRAPEFGTISAEGVDQDNSDDYFLVVTDFLTPTRLYLDNAHAPRRELLKTQPAFFNAGGMEISQHEASSADGTRVPYFQVSRKNLTLDGRNPTLLNGYGGFEVSLTPYYSATTGVEWLEKGGVYVIANIRGGGEFGPSWHNAAIKQNRQRAYEDFAAVAQDLIARKVTTPPRLGIMGGSNGGLLMGVMLTQHPELFGAVVCQSPLLDMKRYTHLLAGASWAAEYGDPDKTEDWAYISRYSPYQNASAEKKYPRILFTTSTRDDRVHPGHARKMAALLGAQGHDELFYENIEGGHAGAADNRQHAFMAALEFTFLQRQLMGP